MKNIAILGSTGSIGTQTLDVARKNEDLRVVAVSAGKNTGSSAWLCELNAGSGGSAGAD